LPSLPKETQKYFNISRDLADVVVVVAEEENRAGSNI
jgi:hypothetical protein